MTTKTSGIRPPPCWSAVSGPGRRWQGPAEAFRSGGEPLARAEDTGGFDLYLLDILMPGLNGIDAGRKLRQLGDGGEIIYLTNSNEFAADSYDVRAFFYLLKPVAEAKLFPVPDKAAEQLHRRRNEGIPVSPPEGKRRILFARILYVERVGRCMRYHCGDGEFGSQAIRVPFREMAAPLLAGRRFCLRGASFVLNLQHVTAAQSQTALPRAAWERRPC